MQTRRKLRKVGGSVMLPIPPEMLKELGLEAGKEVVLTSEGGVVRMTPSEPGPPEDLIEFAHRFTKKYETALKNLAQR